MERASWRPILDGDDAARARAAIAAIAERVAHTELDAPGFMGGWAGVALLHAYLAKDGGDEGDVAADRAHDALARALEGLGADDVGPWFATGFAGVAWVLEHVKDVVDADDETLAQLDGVVAELLARDPWPFEYELLYGAVGLGVYALERARHGDLARVIAHLDVLALRTPDGGATWWSHDIPDCPDPRGYHNLGLAHGVAGAAALCAEACAAGVELARARPLLDGAVAWLCAQDRPDAAPRFPGWIGAGAHPACARNGWCYGDLAIACTLVRAGTVADHAPWISRGRALAHAMARGPVDDLPDVGLTFCHGTAGRAHLLNRLAHALGDANLFAAAHRYYLETLERIPRSDLARSNLSNGWSGIALALLAAVSPIEPRWDRAFLVALPPAY